MTTFSPNLSRTWRRTCVLVAAVIGLLGGCGDEFAQLGDCQSDGDCPTGLVCYDQRVCVSSSEKTHAVVMRLAPPPGQGMVLEHFDASVGGEVPTVGKTWQLTTPAAVRGTVVRSLDTFHSSISGTLIATAPGKVSGTSVRYDTTSHSTPRTFSGSDKLHGFELLLQIGPTYAVTFWPDSELIPPYYAELKVGGDTEDWTVKLPADKDLLTITGRIVSRPAKQPGCQGQEVVPCKGCAPLEGLRVMLLDGKSRIRSGRAITDENGAFELRGDPSGGPVHLHFEPAKGSAALPYGTLATEIDLPALRKKEQKTLNLGDLDVGPLSALAPRKLVVVDNTAAPVGGATVKVSTQLKSPNCCKNQKSGAPQPRFIHLALKLSQPTNAKGEVTFSLPAGPARIEVVPSVEHHVGRWLQENVEIGDKAITVSCSNRALQRGAITNFKNKPVEGAQVQFLPLGEPTRPPVSVVTDADGRFHAPVDIGRWAVSIEPPVDAGLGRYSRHTLEIEAGQDPLPLDISLPPPSVMVGKVLDQSGMALAGVLVDVMANKLVSLAGTESEKKTDGTQALLVMETHLLATTVTGADGRFEVLIETSQLSD